MQADAGIRKMDFNKWIILFFLLKERSNGDVFRIPAYACMENLFMAQRHARSTIIPLQIQLALTTPEVFLWKYAAGFTSL